MSPWERRRISRFHCFVANPCTRSERGTSRALSLSLFYPNTTKNEREGLLTKYLGPHLFVVAMTGQFRRRNGMDEWAARGQLSVSCGSFSAVACCLGFIRRCESATPTNSSPLWTRQVLCFAQSVALTVNLWCNRSISCFGRSDSCNVSKFGRHLGLICLSWP